MIEDMAKEIMDKEIENVMFKINRDDKDILVGINKDDEIVKIIEDDLMGVFDALFEKKLIKELRYFRGIVNRAEETMCEEKDKYRSKFVKKFNREARVDNDDDVLVYSCWIEDNYKDYDIYKLILRYNNLKRFKLNGCLYEDKKYKYKRGLESEVLNGNFGK